MATDSDVKATITSENGFYVGDVCYQLSDEDYKGDWHAKDYSDFEGEHELRGHKFAIGGTKYGDGVYYDNNGHAYHVDSGTIGILPLALCQDQAPEKLNKFGKFIDAKNATFNSNDGYFLIQFDAQISLCIDAHGEDDEED